ncbi:hypothetical protein FRZ67_02765 [Panacibacter ginsenosidivorans]|uniref:Uncharacterized protein n=1 Tax=Panacibacter ginsenosidivorans TaxID=1813871 RepID=A0A5B8V529_9BACT|nr:hypothetical protein [Panacibacter ginsenosidivorans]QEC66279.1 hypothetical protein FRZ67_02765 [Panacibacter ginsenosidivorans]
MKKNSLTRFILAGFLISVFSNTAVVSPHILTAVEPHLLVPNGFSFIDSLYIILLSAGLSILIFAITFSIIYIVAKIFAGMQKNKSFWLLMIIGIIVAVIADKFINTPLAKYNDQTDWISMIAAFSVLISMSSQYLFFINDGTENNIIDSVNNPHSQAAL